MAAAHIVLNRRSDEVLTAMIPNGLGKLYD